MIVDDTPSNMELLRLALQTQHDVVTATNSDEALLWIEHNGPPDLILLDVIMPGMDGYTLCEHLKRDPETAGIPVIFLTAKGDPADELRGLRCGALDYIIKPAPALLVRTRVENHLALKRAQDLLERANRSLSGEVVALEAGIRGLATMNAALGRSAVQQLNRIQAYMETMLAIMCRMPAWQETLTPMVVSKMARASVLYDIGKLGIAVELLRKPEPLSAEDRAIMQTHAELGGQALQGIINEIEAELGDLVDRPAGVSSPLLFLELARDMALSHHENWDGSGYPLGLSGDAIPLCAQLVGLLDMYDALLSRRPHKEPWSREQARDTLRACRGQRFSPLLMQVFEAAEPDLYAIWQRQSQTLERE